MSVKIMKRVTCDVCGKEWETSEDLNFNYGVLIEDEHGRHVTRALDLCVVCRDRATVLSEVVTTEPTGHTLPPDFYEPEMKVVGVGYEWTGDDSGNRH